MKRRRRSYRRNAITSEDMMHLAFAGVAGIALGFIMARKSQVATAGLGLDYHDPRMRRHEDYMSYPRGWL